MNTPDLFLINFLPRPAEGKAGTVQLIYDRSREHLTPTDIAIDPSGAMKSG